MFISAQTWGTETRSRSLHLSNSLISSIDNKALHRDLALSGDGNAAPESPVSSSNFRQRSTKRIPKLQTRNLNPASDARLSPYYEGPRWHWKPSQPAHSPPLNHPTHHRASEGAALEPLGPNPGSFPTPGQANPDGNRRFQWIAPPLFIFFFWPERKRGRAGSEGPEVIFNWPGEGEEMQARSRRSPSLGVWTSQQSTSRKAGLVNKIALA